MPDAPSTPAEAQPGDPPATKWLRPVLFALGVLLLAAAAWAVWRQQAALAGMLAAVRAAPRWMPFALAASLLANWVLSSVVFWVLTLRHARVDFPAMLRLTAAAWLLNYLPARPGLVGRLAFQRIVHGIPLRAGVLIVVWSIASTGVAATAMLGAVWFGGLTAAALLAAAGLAVASALTAVIARRGPRPPGAAPTPVTLAVAAAVAWRLVEMANWSLRYALVFAMIGSPIAPANAVLYAAAAQAASFIPVPLGIREWVIAALAPQAALGLAADLLNRGAEIVMALIVGTGSARRLAADLARAGGK